MQVNHLFGSECEFTTTVVGQKITKQSLVVSSKDIHMVLEFDSNFLLPKDLEKIAQDIRREQGSQLRVANEQECDDAIAIGRDFLRKNTVLSKREKNLAYVIAEYELNKSNLTLYKDNISAVEDPEDDVNDYDEDDDDWDDDDEWDDDSYDENDPF